MLSGFKVKLIPDAALRAEPKDDARRGVPVVDLKVKQTR